MAIDYGAVCPTLSQYISIEDITADTAPPEEPQPALFSLTQSVAETVYARLLVDPQYTTIASEEHVPVELVKEMHEELLAFKNYTEE